MAVEFRHPRAPQTPAVLLDVPRSKGVVGIPITYQLGSQPQRILTENARRLGAYLWGLGQGLPAAGQTTAPAAGVAVTPKLTLPPGIYDVYVVLSFIGGAPVAGTDTLNWQLILGAGAAVGSAVAGSQVGAGVFSVPASLNQPTSRTIRVVVPAPLSLQVAAVGAATGGVIYQAELLVSSLTPVVVGPDKANIGQGNLDGARGWGIGPVPFFLTSEQELWALAQSLTQPAVLGVWEVFKQPRGRAEISPDGSLPG